MTVLINYLLWELGQSVYGVDIDPNNSKGKVKVKSQRLGRLELELIKEVRQDLKVKSAKYIFPNGQKTSYDFLKLGTQTQKTTQPLTSNSLYGLIKNVVLWELSNSAYNVNINPKTNKGKIKVNTQHLGKLEVKLIKDKQQGLKAKALEHITPSGRKRTYTF